VGALALTGVVLSAFPKIFDGPGNRYFVVPVMLFTLTVLVSLNELLFSGPWRAGALVAVVVLGSWLPQLPAGEWRSTPAPAWSDEVARLPAICKPAASGDFPDQALAYQMVFMPFWPSDYPGVEIHEPTHPNVGCLIFRKWLDYVGLLKPACAVPCGSSLASSGSPAWGIFQILFLVAYLESVPARAVVWALAKWIALAWLVSDQSITCWIN
jgi:hypothetical protein